MNASLTRREALSTAATWLGSSLALAGSDSPGRSSYQLATFSVDVTPPIGHACMGGGIAPVQRIDDPLFVHGFAFIGAGKPIVLASVDWCEIRNDAYDRWRAALAGAVETQPERVLVTSVHQHDAPIADLEAQRLLQQHKSAGSICDLDFHERTVLHVVKGVRECVQSPRTITHIGIGQAKVDKVASNRRYLGAGGKPQFGRMSATRDAGIREQPEGTIDPFLKTISFWNGEKAVAALSCYATHPMSYYGKGGVSSDFVGLARKRRQADDPAVFQIYASGCSGNVTAGKYNDGAPEKRPVLADRLYQAMNAAWRATIRHPLKQVSYRTVSLRLEPRNSAGFTREDLTKRLTTDPKPFGQCLAALGLSWRKRADAGHRIDVPVLDLGVAQLLLLPGESYVEYQLLAQKLRPHSFALTMGYGECAPGYIPIERAWEEGDGNLHDWCWVAPGSERAMTAAIEAALKK